MSSTMEYRGYLGSVEFSEKDKVFFGKAMGIRALISYEGTTAQQQEPRICPPISAQHIRGSNFFHILQRLYYLLVNLIQE